MWSKLNRALFKRTSTFLVVIAGGAFVFERTLDLGAQAIFESLNKGKLWKDIKHKYEQPAE
ncbi:cytochrome b-c1 complex subunit 9 [Hyposmocoma kahamanoa]|uniref:cytochrome b-c1 complex subunit 9 n=1 Tax=Hyposmocoma kahamanoa TaxID=1477025 RepID=UPI000E6D67EB|nr:cytochrome b-c1 complex subunit 9 [Hyposmocoma kahamanoa]XP_026333781.1 cytochrome b-c1 complex subunit 9 [Hyposmocoma kahamanoa]